MGRGTRNALFKRVTGDCPNECSGHGYCKDTDFNKCICYNNWRGIYCHARAWTDLGNFSSSLSGDPCRLHLQIFNIALCPLPQKYPPAQHHMPYRYVYAFFHNPPAFTCWHWDKGGKTTTHTCCQARVRPGSHGVAFHQATIRRIRGSRKSSAPIW